MLQHSRISPTDYNSYPPSRGSTQESVKLESTDTPDLGAPISAQQSGFHFGSDPAYNYSFMSTQQWKAPMRSPLDGTHPFEPTTNPGRVKFDLPLMDSGPHGTQDDSYDDGDADSFGDSQPIASTSRSGGSSDKSGEKHIRRRSSKGESRFFPRGSCWVGIEVSRSLRSVSKTQMQVRTDGTEYSLQELRHPQRWSVHCFICTAISCVYRRY